MKSQTVKESFSRLRKGKEKEKERKAVVNENRGTLYNGPRNIQIRNFLYLCKR